MKRPISIPLCVHSGLWESQLSDNAVVETSVVRSRCQARQRCQYHSLLIMRLHPLRANESVSAF
jgi:hypothetical protein